MFHECSVTHNDHILDFHTADMIITADCIVTTDTKICPDRLYLLILLVQYPFLCGFCAQRMLRPTTLGCHFSAVIVITMFNMKMHFICIHLIIHVNLLLITKRFVYSKCTCFHSHVLELLRLNLNRKRSIITQYESVFC